MPFFELSWFFGVNKRSRCLKKVDEMVRSIQVNFQDDLKVKTIFLRLNSVPGYILFVDFRLWIVITPPPPPPYTP